MACFKANRISSFSSAVSLYTRALDSKALFNSNEGFSVVAPIKVTVPSSI